MTHPPCTSATFALPGFRHAPVRRGWGRTALVLLWFAVALATLPRLHAGERPMSQGSLGGPPPSSGS